METYVNRLLSDINAVKNAIKYKYNNGLAEGSVNKIKLTERIMYGRNREYPKVCVNLQTDVR